jgi:7,8-dihydropterin-6-yl-methyl-4-(beta-D-ribofuranosyl)aminobenzene 5'-phosphate synthase
MQITILYDNESIREGLRADWGFSCLVEAHDKRILFDTGASGSILFANMDALGVAPASIDTVFISHVHFDHAGGLSAFLDANSDVAVYAPAPLRGIMRSRETIYVETPQQLLEGVHTTGLLQGMEQSLVVEAEEGLIVVAGCSHPGVGEILDAAAQLGEPYALIGGLHGFTEFERLRNLQIVCPTHCTRHKDEIQSRYPEKFTRGGVGTVITI